MEHPVYIRIPTQNELPHLKNRSAAEAVISVLMSAQMRGWLRLHGFVVLPGALEIVATPLKQGVAGVVAHLQAETIPLLSVMMPEAGFFWAMRYHTVDLTTQLALDAQLQMLLLAPVAHSIVKTAAEYPYSSANPRYAASVAPYAGFQRITGETPAVTNGAATPAAAPSAVTVASSVTVAAPAPTLERLPADDDEATAVLPETLMRQAMAEAEKRDVKL